MAVRVNQYLRYKNWRESRRAVRAWLGMAAKGRPEPVNEQAAAPRVISLGEADRLSPWIGHHFIMPARQCIACTQ